MNEERQHYNLPVPEKNRSGAYATDSLTLSFGGPSAAQATAPFQMDSLPAAGPPEDRVEESMGHAPVMFFFWDQQIEVLPFFIEFQLICALLQLLLELVLFC